MIRPEVIIAEYYTKKLLIFEEDINVVIKVIEIGDKTIALELIHKAIDKLYNTLNLTK